MKLRFLQLSMAALLLPAIAMGQDSIAIPPPPVVADETTYDFGGECCSNSCGDECSDGCCLGGLIARSDQAFCSWISPMTNPVYFEDPRTLSELRFIFANHVIPGDNLLGGGSIQLFAMQFRIALTERLSIIAVKDGYVDMNTHLLPDTDGWANIAVGLKYNVIRDPCSQLLVSVGAVHEFPTGSNEVFQGEGDGDSSFFITAGKGFGSSHVLAATGVRVPINHTDGSQLYFASAHVDNEVMDGIYAFFEANYFHYVRGGAGDLFGGVPLGFDGGDLFNLGNAGITGAGATGQDIVTLAVGTKFILMENTELGIAWEYPVTDNLAATGLRNQVINNRLTVDFILRY